MQSPRSRLLRPLRHWGGVAAVDNDVAVDAQAEGAGAKAVADDAANKATVPASSENTSGAASKNEISAPASSDDSSSDKSSASDDVSSKKDATEQIEITSGESGYYVYLYTKVVGNTAGLTLKVNGNGWYTIGRVWVDGISNPAQGPTDYATSGDDYNKVISALSNPNNVDLYGVNDINLDDIKWSVAGQSTGLKTASGAIDYDTSTNLTWHLDGYVDLDKVGFGSIRFHYIDKETKATIAKDKSVTAEVTGKEFDFSSYQISIEGYTFDEADPSSVVVEKNTTKVVTLYYKKLPKRQIVMQAKSGTATYNGQEQSASGFEADTFEFDGVKYTVSGLTATAKGTDVGTYKSAVEGTAVVKDPKGNNVTAQFDVTANGGELIITPVEAKVTVTVKGNTATEPYNGTEQSVEGYTFVSADNPLYAETDVSFSGDAVAKGTDAGTYPMGLAASQFSNANPNFANVEFVVEDGSIVIDPATLTVTTPSASRVYNGQPLTAEGNITGFVNGETAGFKTTGAQTAVGTSDNTYAIDWAAAGATAKQSNYTIAENVGTLTVTAQSIVPDPVPSISTVYGTPSRRRRILMVSASSADPADASSAPSTSSNASEPKDASVLGSSPALDSVSPL